MPTQKIDPKVIFASDAPSTDKPPVFNDKTKGWDEARANDGRPTIKQMNKLQQDTDLKILWLNENSVTPYDASIDYPDGAVAIKDGSFKQLVSGAWVEFLNDFASLDENRKVPVAELPSATPSVAGITKLINDLTTGGTDAALTAEAGKLFFNMFSSLHGVDGYQKIPNPSNTDKPLIIQWGWTPNMNGNTTAEITLPTTFPNSFFVGVCCYDYPIYPNVYPSLAIRRGSTLSKVQLGFKGAASELFRAFYIVIGN